MFAVTKGSLLAAYLGSSKGFELPDDTSPVVVGGLCLMNATADTKTGEADLVGHHKFVAASRWIEDGRNVGGGRASKPKASKPKASKPKASKDKAPSSDQSGGSD